MGLLLLLMSRVNAEMHRGIRAELGELLGLGGEDWILREEAFWIWDNLGFLGRSLPAELESLGYCWYGLAFLGRHFNVHLIKKKMGRTSGK